MTTQERIEKAIKDKNKRLDKTAASILVSWATNCAVEIASQRALSREDTQRDIIIWREWFINSYKEWMLENGPIDGGDTRLGEQWQEEYAKMSEIESINEEIQSINEEEIPFL